MAMNALQTLLGIELPIIQAPMAGVQDSALTIAVSNAGGLGSLPCGMLTADGIAREIATIRAGTSQPFNINFFCHSPPTFDEERDVRWRNALSPYFAELGLETGAIAKTASRAPFDAVAAELIEDLKPPVVSFHFGLPSEQLLARVRASGAKIFSSATTIAEAQWLESKGVDAIIAQGLEAGGHRGHFLSDDLTLQMGTFALLPQIVKAVRVPVIAAGGITDAQGVAASIALGASAVQPGTAYLLCPESTTSAVHRTALKSAAATHTALTNLFSGRPARGIVNRVMQDLGAISELAPEFPLASAAIAPLRAKAESMGRGDFSPVWSGQNNSGCKEMGAAELTRELAATALAERRARG
jgi:nitronate monooxygenase